MYKLHASQVSAEKAASDLGTSSLEQFSAKLLLVESVRESGMQVRAREAVLGFPMDGAPTGSPARPLLACWGGMRATIVRGSLGRLLLGVVLLGLLSLGPSELWARGKQSKAPEQWASVSFVVLRASNEKPVRNASVVIHFLRKDGSQDDEGFQLKTDAEGRASIEDIPYGKLRLQVVARGLQTYGEDVEINSAQQEFVIRLNPPADQVTIYK